MTPKIAEHKPILHIYQDGDQFFAALPDFVDLQESEVAFVDPSIILEILATIDSKARATPGRLAGDGDGARL